MNDTKTIQAEVIQPAPGGEPQSQAVMVRETGGALGRPLSIEELHRNLEFIRSVMQREMQEGQDYGKIPGCGDKPGLFQPGAQKLLLTFQLREQVRREVLRELNYGGLAPGHREYEITLTVFPAGQGPGSGWDGVGTCSTLEAKYRWRKAERRCPKCGKHTIIQGKAEYGGGWLCFKKKGGCGEKFPEDDKRIIEQAAGQVENENPADYWNTVRKMAFKRALVHAAINATNTSELWSQDLEDLPARDEEPEPRAPGKAAAPVTPAKSTSRPAKSASPAAKAAPAPAKSAPRSSIYATEKTRQWMILQFQECADLFQEYCEKVWLIPGQETVADLPLRFVPTSHAQMKELREKVTDFGNGAPAEAPSWAPNPEPDNGKAAKPAGKVAAAVTQSPAKVAETAKKTAAAEDEWWRKVIIPVPHKGETRNEYLKHPETIGELYDKRHDTTDEGQAARQRLWGFINHFEPKGWTKKDGTDMPPSDTDLRFREALDALSEYHEKNHPDEKL